MPLPRSLRPPFYVGDRILYTGSQWGPMLDSWDAGRQGVIERNERAGPGFPRPFSIANIGGQQLLVFAEDAPDFTLLPGGPTPVPPYAVGQRVRVTDPTWSDHLLEMDAPLEGDVVFTWRKTRSAGSVIRLGDVDVTLDSRHAHRVELLPAIVALEEVEEFN